MRSHPILCAVTLALVGGGVARAEQITVMSRVTIKNVECSPVNGAASLSPARVFFFPHDRKGGEAAEMVIVPQVSYPVENPINALAVNEGKQLCEKLGARVGKEVNLLVTMDGFGWPALVGFLERDPKTGLDAGHMLTLSAVDDKKLRNTSVEFHKWINKGRPQAKRPQLSLMR